jgi:NAD(P)-dependent dehydrogenase (short-subunit alcohol dehydrogenase family)
VTDWVPTTRVAIVTGASSGIGAATAVALVRKGWHLALCGRSRSALDAVAADTDALVIPGDLLDASYCRRAMDAAVETYGRLDGLVLNAGLATTGTAEETSLADWQRTLQVNLTAPFLMARAALPALRETLGSVVAVGSIGALRAAPRSVAYAASKAGLVMLTHALAVDHGPEGVRVNCVCPGWTRSTMSDEEMARLANELGGSTEDAYARVTALVPQRRPAEPAEIAESIAWLLSPEASYVNGTTLTVDGGTSIVDAGTAVFTSAVDTP